MASTIFTKEIVEQLNNQQKSGTVHPYTCGGGNGEKECKRTISYDKRRRGEDIDYTDENEGVLIATENGWICPCGKYTQNWHNLDATSLNP